MQVFVKVRKKGNKAARMFLTILGLLAILGAIVLSLMYKPELTFFFIIWIILWIEDRLMKEENYEEEES